ncbi:MAG: S-layer homology domain-containing protein [Deinococcales bacterium]
MPSNHWAAASILRMTQAGIIGGFPDGYFYGDSLLTRYQLVVMLDRVYTAAQEQNLAAKNAEIESLKARVDQLAAMVGVSSVVALPLDGRSISPQQSLPQSQSTSQTTDQLSQASGQTSTGTIVPGPPGTLPGAGGLSVQAAPQGFQQQGFQQQSLQTLYKTPLQQPIQQPSQQPGFPSFQTPAIKQMLNPVKDLPSPARL